MIFVTNVTLAVYNLLLCDLQPVTFKTLMVPFIVDFRPQKVSFRETKPKGLHSNL